MVELSESDIEELSQICPGGTFQNVNLASISQWEIGGKADLILQPSTADEVAEIRQWMYRRAVPHLTIGLTTNLLFSDEGLRVPCIQIGSRMGALSICEKTLHTKAGAWVPGIARELMKAGLAGAEHICGIPGTIGGLICMNGGSQRKAIGNNLVEVESVDCLGHRKVRRPEECGFSYRNSIFQNNGEIITAATFDFTPAPLSEIRYRMLEILAQRRGKFPRKTPNCGSVFKSNPAMYEEFGPPGAVIEKLGFKGHRIGGAEVSTQHANFIINNGSASADDILKLIHLVQATVNDIVGYKLESEVRYVLASGAIISADNATY